MVGNYVPEDRRIGYKKETEWFAWYPVKTDKGYRLFTNVIRIFEIVSDDTGSFSKALDFFGFGTLAKEQITYKAKI